MSANEFSIEEVVVLPHKDDGKERNIGIIETVPYEYDKIVYALTCEDDEGTKKVIIDIDEEALTLEEGDRKVSIDNSVDELLEELICKYEEVAKK